jgi:hypothetical protein
MGRFLAKPGMTGEYESCTYRVYADGKNLTKAAAARTGQPVIHNFILFLVLRKTISFPAYDLAATARLSGGVFELLNSLLKSKVFNAIATERMTTDMESVVCAHGTNLGILQS